MNSLRSIEAAEAEVHHGYGLCDDLYAAVCRPLTRPSSSEPLRPAIPSNACDLPIRQHTGVAHNEVKKGE